MAVCDSVPRACWPGAAQPAHSSCCSSARHPAQSIACRAPPPQHADQAPFSFRACPPKQHTRDPAARSTIIRQTVHAARARIMAATMHDDCSWTAAGHCGLWRWLRLCPVCAARDSGAAEYCIELRAVGASRVSAARAAKRRKILRQISPPARPAAHAQPAVLTAPPPAAPVTHRRICCALAPASRRADLPPRRPCLCPLPSLLRAGMTARCAIPCSRPRLARRSPYETCQFASARFLCVSHKRKRQRKWPTDYSTPHATSVGASLSASAHSRSSHLSHSRLAISSASLPLRTLFTPARFTRPDFH